jgi:hypothetical protein
MAARRFIRGRSIDREFALRFAEEWIASWYAHDLGRILSHYTDDFEMSSPLIVQRMDEPSGTLKGKTAVRNYWTRALTRLPDLHFELEVDFPATLAALSQGVLSFGKARRRRAAWIRSSRISCTSRLRQIMVPLHACKIDRP